MVLRPTLPVLTVMLLASTPALCADVADGGQPESVVTTLKDRQGRTVVLTSPVPELVEEIADRVIILERGEILAFDTLEGLRRSTGTRGTLGQVLEEQKPPRWASPSSRTQDRLARSSVGAGSPCRGCSSATRPSTRASGWSALLRKCFATSATERQQWVRFECSFLPRRLRRALSSNEHRHTFPQTSDVCKSARHTCKLIGAGPRQAWP